jgi:cob(I)alamin adenosyltransferase
MKIYTKTGDKGETSTFSGSRVSKAHYRVEAYGTVDELNAQLGLVRDQLSDSTIRSFLLQVQNDLFVIGSILAYDGEDQHPKIPSLPANAVSSIETAIDQLDEQLEPMRFFILPGGHPLISQTHVVRCVCRRAERRIVALSEQAPVPEEIGQYLNRFSDYCFVLARFLAKTYQVEEIPWRSESTSK